MKKVKNKKRIYIIFSHSGTIPAKIIKLFTRYEYSHVSISLQESPYEFYSFARKELNPLIGGFVIENSDTKIFHKFKSIKCKIYEIEVSEKEYQKMRRAVNKYIKKKDDYKYNFFGILSLAFHIKPMCSKNRKFCSQFVTEILEKGNVIDLDIEPEYVTPEMIYKTIIKLKPKCIFEGNVMEYFDSKIYST